MEIKERLSEIFEKYREEFVALNEYLYENPELGLREFKACEAHTQMLVKHGFEVEKGFANLETAFLARYQKGEGGPSIAILAEYDALPGIGHGCGHNLFGVTSIATGILVKECMEDFVGELLVIGTPAEETDGAKVAMAKQGVFDGVDVAMAVHPYGEAHHRSGTSQAMEALQFTFHGKTAHAAGEPEKGVNALDAVLILFNSINALRQQTSETSRIHGIITEGGKAANIIPDLAIANFYVRTETLDTLRDLTEKVKNCAKGAALATGTQLDITNYETTFADLVTNQRLSALYEKHLKSLGVTDIRSDKKGGSTDMGDVSHACPAIHPYFPLTTEHLICHSVEFAKATIAPEAYKGMKEATLAMALTALELFQNKEVLKEIKEEFQKTFSK